VLLSADGGGLRCSAHYSAIEISRHWKRRSLYYPLPTLREKQPVRSNEGKR